jgi:4-hydroxy-4-methyl-2-oxoglutarate aldolase
VRQGDLIVADDDGIVCVPKQHAAEIIKWAEEHERVEEIVKEMILQEGVAPGKYYNAETFARLHEDDSYKVV